MTFSHDAARLITLNNLSLITQAAIYPMESWGQLLGQGYFCLSRYCSMNEIFVAFWTVNICEMNFEFMMGFGIAEIERVCDVIKDCCHWEHPHPNMGLKH